eukprot:8968090-Pyramimonas_sp.AAC.1
MRDARRARRRRDARRWCARVRAVVRFAWRTYSSPTYSKRPIGSIQNPLDAREGCEAKPPPPPPAEATGGGAHFNGAVGGGGVGGTTLRG